MKEVIIVNVGQCGIALGDAVQTQLALENGVNDMIIQNKDLEFQAKSFYYETQNGQYVPRTVFIGNDAGLSKQKCYAKQNFGPIRHLVEKCDQLQGFIIISGQQQVNTTMTELSKDYPLIPQYNFMMLQERYSHQNVIDITQSFSALEEMSEAIVLMDEEQINQRKLGIKDQNKLLASMICQSMATINQPFKRMLDITTFPMHLMPTTQLKYLSVGYDANYSHIYSNNLSGIDYDQGKFIKSGLIFRGEPITDLVKSASQLTKQLVVGMIDKQGPGVVQISNHTQNLCVLEQCINKVKTMPTQFITSELTLDDKLNSIVETYKQHT